MSFGGQTQTQKFILVGLELNAQRRLRRRRDESSHWRVARLPVRITSFWRGEPSRRQQTHIAAFFFRLQLVSPTKIYFPSNRMLSIKHNLIIKLIIQIEANLQDESIKHN